MNLLNDPEFWVGVGFVAVIVLLVWKGVPKLVAGMLDKRASAIAAELEEAKRLREEAALLLADYRAKAASAEGEAEIILTEARANAARFAKETRAALKTQIARRVQAAEDKIAQAEAAAMNEIRGLAADAATAAAEKLITARLDEKRAGSLIADSIRAIPGKLN